MNPEIREPAVAGRFYSADARRLEQDLARLLEPAAVESTAVALVAPHAGYMYSGAIAGAGYARVRVPSRAIVLCPNHTGLGVEKSIWSRGAWRLPGGDVAVAEELALCVREAARLEDDALAHLREHAIEVQLPFLRARRRDVRVVPICLSRLSYAECVTVGEGLARAVEAEPAAERPLLVASTDMSHYISAERASELDRLALERVTALDPRGLYEVVTRHDISMCGYIPTTVALVAACALGATRATLVRYGNSGEASGDFDRVVGYASVVVS
jgi:AmmeMemoRadiSam system protein B